MSCCKPESDIAILMLVIPSVTYHSYFTRGHCRTRFKGLNNYISTLRLPIMLEIVYMLMAAYCALNYASIMCTSTGDITLVVKQSKQF